MTSLYQLSRLLIIIRKINSNQRFSKEKLLELVNRELSETRDYPPISERTLERDIKILKEAPFNMNIILDRTIGYFVEENNFEGLDIEQLLEPFDILNALSADTGLQDIIITEKYTNKGTEHLYKLIKTIRNTEKIAFDYSKYLDNGITERVLEPYAIKLLKGQWYLVGKLENEIDLKTFGLDRIHNLRLLNQKFRKDKSLNIKEKFKHSFGIYSSEEYPIEDVLLAFDVADGNYLKVVPLHDTQEIIEETEDKIIIKLKLRITEDFIMALLSRSWSLQVLEPISLKNRVSDIYRKALERNL
jgi:predicted DNA-binding transcriptional regulator YafY